jgi:hypothetical protein
MSDTTLPASSIDEALPLLRRPFPPEALNFKIQAQDRGDPPRWGQVVSYLNARDVSGRLNAVCGGRWHARYRPLAAELRPVLVGNQGQVRPDSTVFVVCALTVFGVTREDVGEARDDPQRVRAPKAAYSDALKRAAVQFGLGHVVYAMPRRFMNVGGGIGRLAVKGSRLRLSADNEQWLRERYAEWLEEEGVALFGAVLDHGARAGMVGDEEAAEPEGPEAPTSIAVTRAARATDAGGYPAAMVAGLADLLFGEAGAAGLEPGQVEQVVGLLECASAGQVPPGLLATQLDRALKVRDRAEARRLFCAWLTKRADRVATEGGEGEAQAA